MKRITVLTLLATGVGATAVLTPCVSYAESTHTGTVERVWEDGFRLQSGNRSLRVDAWNVYGDQTANNIEVGDTLTVTGEYEGIDFDAFSVAAAD